MLKVDPYHKLKSLALILSGISLWLITMYGDLNPVFITLICIFAGIYLLIYLITEFKNKNYRTYFAGVTHRVHGRNAQIASGIEIAVLLMMLVPAVFYMLNPDFLIMLMKRFFSETILVVIFNIILLWLLFSHTHIMISRNIYRYKYPKKTTLTLFRKKIL